MTQEELQDLSRRAAKLLPDDLRQKFGLYKGMVDSGNSTAIPIWLYESTEACAEIMVRVPQLMRYGVWEAIRSKARELIAAGMEEMQAFRTAVLLTLAEVMG